MCGTAGFVGEGNRGDLVQITFERVIGVLTVKDSGSETGVFGTSASLIVDLAGGTQPGIVYFVRA